MRGLVKHESFLQFYCSEVVNLLLLFVCWFLFLVETNDPAADNPIRGK